MDKLRRDVEGIGGFFEDLPALMIVLIATSIFIVSMISTVMTYQKYTEKVYLQNNLDRFVNEMRNFGFLTLDEIEGRFYGERVNTLNEKNITDNFPSLTRNFNFSVIIDDRSSYKIKYETHVNEIPKDTEVFSESTSITIVDSMGNEHLGKMIISIWKR